MSFRPGLLASTSRALTPTATVRLQYAVRQYASASSTTAPKLETKKNITIQETDKKIKEQQRAVRRMPVHIDVATFYDKVIFENTVDPKYRPEWIFKKGGWSYLKERVKRHFQNKNFSFDVAALGLVPNYIVERTRVNKFLNFFKHQERLFRPLLKDFEKQYETFQRAQATGDVPTIRSVSMSEARERATSIAQSGAKSQWELVKNVTSPRIVSIRHGPADMTSTKTSTQICVSFDTIQRVSNRRGSKEVHLIDNVLFDTTNNQPWRIKALLKETPPPFNA